MCLPPLKPFVKLFALCLGSFFMLAAAAQVKQRQWYNTSHATTTSAASTVARAARFTTTTDGGQPCTTSTFFMHIPTLPGQKISISVVKATAAGDYIIAGNLVTLDGTSSVGILMRMDNAGNILAQQAVNAGNINTLVLAMDVLPNGSIVIAGSVKNGPFNSFVSYFDASFNSKWLHTYNAKQAVSKMSAYVTNDGRFAIAMQLPGAVTCLMLKNTGAQSWNTLVSPAGFTGLVSFTEMPDGNMGLFTNCIQGGKNVTLLTSLQNASGLAAGSYIQGDDESHFLSVANFNNRLSVLGVIKTNQGYTLGRNITYDGKTIVRHQTYKIGLPVDFTATAAMDNAGDIMALCLPGQEKIVLIKHFNYYQPNIEYTKAYSLPKAAGMAGVAKSYDGGFLFGVNTKDSLEVLLIKTDSIGLLGGCGKPTDITNSLAETFQITNTAVADNVTLAGVFGTVASAYSNIITLKPQFDCRQNYCPEPPTEDTCLPMYYKTYRSHSFSDLFLQGFIMPGNNQLMQTARYDIVTGHSNTLSFELKLFDEKGNYIKGAVPFINGVNIAADARKVDDNHIMLNSNASEGGVPGCTLTLVSGSLKVIWSKSVKIPAVGGSPDGPNAEDWVKDDEGNYYFVSCHPGFNSPSEAFIYKMDALGNPVWTKGYSFAQQSFSTASAITTNNTIVLIMGGNGGASGTLAVSKADGNVLNSYTYTNDGGGLVYHRFAKYYNGRIYYTTNDKAEALTVVIFDSTGKALTRRTISNLSIPRASAFKDGFLYVETQYNSGSTFEEVILKFDSRANIIAATIYPMQRNGLPKSLEVSPEGNVYSAGSFFDGEYGYGFIRKYDNNTLLGTCGQPFTSPVIVDNDPQAQTNTATPVPATVQPFNLPITLVPESEGLAVDNILCSSINTCNSVKISGPAAVCQVNTEYNYSIKKNAGCTATPVWVYDTAFATISKFTDTSASVLFKKTGTVQFKALLNGGCKIYADSMVVAIQKQAATLSLGRDTALCPNDTLLLKAGAGFSTYKWQDGSADSSYHVKQAGKYYVQVSNTCNEQFGDTIVISGLTVPSLNIGNDTAICLNDTLHIQAAAGFAGYTWPTDVTAAGRNAAYIAKQDETIIIKATTKEGCPAADTISISVKQPRPVSLGRDTSFCTGDSVIINAGNGYINYQWSDGSTNQQTVAHSAGSYWVKAQDVNKCYATDTMQVLAAYPLPIVALANPAPLCTGGKRILDAGSFTGYLWQDGTMQRYFTADTTGTYTVQVTDNNGCTGSGQTAVLEVIPLPANFLKSTDSLCQYDKLTLTPVGDFSTYAWSNGATTPDIIVDMPGSYTLTVTNNAGCAGSDTIAIVQKQCMPGFYVPNAFTPNGDGHNDVFKPSLFGNLQAYFFCIYNRFGEMVFKTNNPGEGWDGNYKGKPFDSGTTFVWRCQYQLQGDKPMSAKGTLVLIK